MLGRMTGILIGLFAALNLDLVWFGVLVAKYIGISLLTPPVEFNIYVVATATDNSIPLQTIDRGCYWFLACEIVIMTLLIAFPQISLYLPNLMNWVGLARTTSAAGPAACGAPAPCADAA
jgi:C4-dicarboxylate transporter, DctM subunit